MPEKVQVALVPVKPQQVAELVHLTDFEIPVVVDLITQGGAADAQHHGCIAQCDAFSHNAGEEQHGICHKKSLLLVSNSGCDAQSLVVL